MKVCMLAYTWYEPDNRVRRYAETLVKRGDQVDAVVLRREGQPSKMEVVEGVCVYRIQRRVINEKGKITYLAKLLLFFVRSFFFLAWKQLRDPYDLIHVHSVPDFEVFAALEASEIVARLDAAGIANARINTVAEVWAHPQLAARERWTSVDTPAGPVPALKPPAMLRGVDARMDAVPALGEHTDGILRELGISNERIGRLRLEQVI